MKPVSSFFSSIRSSIRIATLAAIAIAILANGQVAADQPTLTTSYAQWETSYEAAVQESQKTGRPIMLVFTGSDWCSWCHRLGQEVFTTREFARWSTDYVIKLEVDFPQSYELSDSIRMQNQNLKAQFGHHVQSYPTVLFVTSEGRLLGKTGYVAGGADAWIDQAQSIVPTTVKTDLLAKSK